jgi:hypothetical protein
VKLAIEIAEYAGMAPAAVSIAIALILRRILPGAISERWALPVAFAAGLIAGYMLLPSWASLVPRRHWQWLVWLGVLAAAIGPIGLHAHRGVTVRLAAILVVSLTSSWLLVPTWTDLTPARPICIAIVATFLAVSASLTDLLAERVAPNALAASLAASSVCAAIAVAGLVSVTYGRVAGVMAAAFCGALAAGVPGQSAIAMRSILPVYAITVGGTAFVAAIEPKPPMWGLLGLPMAPLLLWCFVSGPAARLRGRTAAVVQFAACVFTLMAITGWLTWSQHTQSADGPW